jgi:hypothetical protein
MDALTLDVEGFGRATALTTFGDLVGEVHAQITGLGADKGYAERRPCYSISPRQPLPAPPTTSIPTTGAETFNQELVEFLP